MRLWHLTIWIVSSFCDVLSGKRRYWSIHRWWSWEDGVIQFIVLPLCFKDSGVQCPFFGHGPNSKIRSWYTCRCTFLKYSIILLGLLHCCTIALILVYVLTVLESYDDMYDFHPNIVNSRWKISFLLGVFFTIYCLLHWVGVGDRTKLRIENGEVDVRFMPSCFLWLICIWLGFLNFCSCKVEESSGGNNVYAEQK